MSRPSKRIVPLVGSSRRITSRAVVLLPQPVSPTIPSVSPRITSNDTPSTACTAPTWRWKRIPRVIGKCLTRSRTSTSASLMPAVLELDASRAAVVRQLAGLSQLAPTAARRVSVVAAGRRRGARSRPATGSSCGSTRRWRVAHVRAARVERAAAGQRDQARRAARDRHERLVARAVEARDRLQQAPRVGVLGRVEDRVGRRLLDDLARRTSRRSRRRCSATTPRSWVIRTTAMSSSRWSRAIRSRICACTVTSSAVVGSSAISTFGSFASAIAIIARWRMPPENSCG